MTQDFKSIKKYLEENDIRLIDFRWCDLWGHWRHVTISARFFTEEMMQHGIGFDGSSIGLKEVTSSDLILIPDLETGFLDPFYEEPTYSFIANIHEADTKAPFEADPREFVRKAEKHLIETGIADESMWGPEYEFFIFDEASFDNRMHSSSFYFNSYESNWEPDESMSGYHIGSHKGYHRINPSDRAQSLRNQVCLMLEEMGYGVKYHHHEGGSGQHEIEPPMQDIYKSTDGTLVAKYLLKNIAYEMGQTITFMPKPLGGEMGSGMHFHQFLRKKGKNLFYDAKSPTLLSELAMQYISGILYHAPALTALTNPSTNSFKRLAPGFEAPTSCFFGRGDRTAAVRQPKYVTDPNEVRIEYRTPDGTCNPYLAIPAMLLAGIDGIQKKMDAKKLNFGPFESEMKNWSEEEWKKIKKIPSSLEGACDALMEDHSFLTESGVFSEAFIKGFCDVKRKEANSLASRPHPYEVELYLDC